VNSLVDFYKKLATKEQQDREKLKLKKKSYIHISVCALHDPQYTIPVV
jgi:hypothetical protein